MSYFMFDGDIAKEYGVETAVVLECMRFWIVHNEANDTNFHDGRYWTYNSARAFAKLFPFINQRLAQRLLKKMEDDDLLIVGNYNKSQYDRTKWYALTDKAMALLGKDLTIDQICEMEDSEDANQNTANGQPIPVNKPVINTNTNKRVFQKPSVSEIAEYCRQRKNAIDPEAFVDYYESTGWRLKGGTKMANWKAAVRNWERMNRERRQHNGGYVQNSRGLTQRDREIQDELDAIRRDRELREAAKRTADSDTQADPKGHNFDTDLTGEL